MRKLLLLTASLMLYGTLIAQTNPCGYEIYHQHLVAQDSSYNFLYHAKKLWLDKYKSEKYRDTGINHHSQPFGEAEPMGMPSAASCLPARYIIPVVVHIVHLPADNTPGSGTNISDTQVQHQIEILNQHFAANHTGIQFCLAKTRSDGAAISGILRYSNGLSTHKMPGETADLFSLQYVYPDGYAHNKYLNIYVVHTILNNQGQDGGMLGYATMPGGPQQGIVIRYDWFGDYTSCSSCNLDTISRGDVLTHELGHYLGLEHTFFGGCSTADSCSTSGDLCCDTPPCQQSTGCSIVNTCHESYNGDLPDAIQNYMGYNDALCKHEFTPDQTDIMHAVLENARAELIEPAHVNTLKLECCFLSAFFGASQTFLCKQQADTVKFEAYDYEAASYYWEIRDSVGTLITTYSDTLPLFSYVFDTSIVKKYSVSLEITRGSDLVSLTRSLLIEMADCGQPLPSTQSSWLFGRFAGILFTDKGVIRNLIPDRNKPIAINSGEGTISVSDTLGNMLFHGGGVGSNIGDFYLFDRNYDTMPNGPVYGDGSSGQGGLVIQVPGSLSRYYLFTVSARYNSSKPVSVEGLRYSIIDMSLNSGNGDVDINHKNVAVRYIPGVYLNPYDSAFMCGESITSVPQCNSQDHWLIVMGQDSTSVAGGGGSGYLYVFSVTSTGISYHSRSDSLVANPFAALKVSPNGQYVICSGSLFRFDRVNGTLSLICEFDPVHGYYGGSFSPDSKLLYLMYTSPTQYPSNTIYQFDLSYSSPELSAKAIGTVLGSSNTALQLGPDNKIYVAQYAQNKLAVIAAPNQRVSADGSNECGFSGNGPLLSSGGIGGMCTQGLPNFSDISKDINNLDFTFSDSGCGNFSFFPVSCSVNNKWYFGDGDSSLAVNASHAYSSPGQYTVMLISGGDTISKQVSTGVQAPQLTGAQVICDTSLMYAYSIINPALEYEYSWQADTGSLFLGSNPYEVFVKWQNSTHIRVLAQNQSNGCLDSVSLPVVSRHFIQNEIADSNRYVCNFTRPDTIRGSFPVSSHTSLAFTYQWRVSLDSLTWQDIAGAYAKDYQPDTLKDTVKYFQRLLILAGCDTFFSNITKRIPESYDISNNSISISEHPDFRECIFEITGSSAGITPALSPLYSWYYVPDDINGSWQQVSGGIGSYKDLSLYMDEADSIFVVRKVGAGSCFSYSDTVMVKTRVSITVQPQDYYTCNNRVYFSVGYDNPDHVTLNFAWMYKDAPHSSPVVIGSINHDTLNYFTSSGFGNYYACMLSSPNCSYTSEWAMYQRNPDTLTWFDAISLSDTLIHEWDSALVIANSTSLLVDSAIFTKQYFWQRSADGISFYNIETAGSSDSFVVKDLRACEGKFYYRLGIRAAESCPVEYSAITPAVSSYTGAKLMMQDYDDDNGTEPNLTTDWRNLYEPPSLFIRYYKDDSTQHQIPNAAEHSAVYVYYNIKNTGTDTSKPANLFLYWTSGGPHGADWPVAWHDMTGNQFEIQNPGSMRFGETISWGDRINQTAIVVPALAPGDSLFDAFYWNTLPNPNDFHSIFNGDTTYPDERALCLLARVETCSNDSFGMSFKETRATRQNIINNRKIVGRNSWLQFIDQEPRIVEYPLTVRSYDGIDLPLRLLMTNVDSCAFQTIGFVTAELSDGLWQEWEAGGFEGTGFSFDAEHTLLIDNLSDFQLNNIHLSPENTEQIKLSFEVTVWPDEPMSCRYVVGQFHGETAEPEGSFVIAVEVSTQEQGSSASIYIPAEEVTQDSLTNINTSIIAEENSETLNRLALAALDQLTIFPNPANKQINFAFEIQQDLPTEIFLTNALGATVATVYRGKLQSGYTLIPWQNQHLTPGLYIAQVKIGAQTRNYKIIITND